MIRFGIAFKASRLAATTIMAQPIDFQAWDREAASKPADYDNLYQMMMTISKESTESVEIWWRMAFITYQTSMNNLKEEVLKSKTQEALQYAERALRLDSEHFNANLWLASAAGKLALLEDNMETKIK